jgi:site-specific DNA-cytosine methylase
METAAFCEIDPYCRKVLAKRWPGVKIHEDVKQLDGRPGTGEIHPFAGSGRSGNGLEAGGWKPEPAICRVAHGIPNRVDRLRAMGNAVVPQLPELIGRAILAYEQQLRMAA